MFSITTGYHWFLRAAIPKTTMTSRTSPHTSDRIPGAATPEATQAWLTDSFSKQPRSTLGRTGLHVSGVGFGGYRTGLDTPEHADSLRLALQGGCNLLDTSTNYMDGQSERLMGRALRSSDIKRERVVVVTKVGYAQGSNLELARKRQAEGKPYAEMNEVSRDCWHCVSPEWISDQLTASLDRLGLETVDVLLLHNPEYFFKAQNSSQDHREYYERLRRAFEYLETEVAQGRIRWYGVSSNTFPEPREAADYTSLEILWEMAEEWTAKNSKPHHFAVIQFPFNLFEPGARLETNNSGKSVLEFAREKGLGTLVNRPLNAFTANRLVRLADFPNHHEIDTIELAKRSLQAATDIESACPVADQIEVSRIAWAHIIKRNWARIGDLLAWRDAFRWQIKPAFEEALTQLKAHAQEEQIPEFTAWLEKYEPTERLLFDAVTAMLEQEAAFRSRRILAALDETARTLKDCSSCELSRKTLRVLLGSAGVSSVLVGMRRPEYIKDVLGEPLKPLEDSESLAALERIQHSLSDFFPDESADPAAITH
jgi:aryl-alcohol dehydrogenase-like predicted oxidoreductase